jgi:cell division protein FtsA
LKGRDPKEITVKNLASIIQARMEEIIEMVQIEIVNSGYSKKLIAGIVVTGGGSQLKHITQLFEYLTGMDTRVGYPTEHLANSNHIENLTSPMFATGIGLVLKGFEKLDAQTEQPDVANPGHVKGHSTKTRGSFFDELIKRGQQFFSDNED